MRAMVLLAYIRLLYAVEREARDRALEAAGRRPLRQERSVPILADIEAYPRREQPHVWPKGPIGEAIAYGLNNWPALVRYTEDGDPRSITMSRSTACEGLRWAGIIRAS